MRSISLKLAHLELETKISEPEQNVMLITSANQLSYTAVLHNDMSTSKFIMYCFYTKQIMSLLCSALYLQNVLIMQRLTISCNIFSREIYFMLLKQGVEVGIRENNVHKNKQVASKTKNAQTVIYV